ncbi:sulfotransferase [Candidatus Neomarinimicrobiota bacterium]
MENNRPIFIVGCERSGTTMLRLILHSHANIAIPPQTKYIKKIYKRRLFFRNLSKLKNRERIIKWFYNNHNKKTKIIDLGLDPNDIQNELMKSGNSLGAILSTIFKLYSKQNNKVRWGDKHPYYIKYLDQLFKLFPNAQVIHVIRDGRDAVASLKSMPWWKNNSIYSMLNWQEAILSGRKAKFKYGSNQFIEILYENIIDDPEKNIKILCDFLEEDFSPKILEFYKIADTAVPNYKMDWHSETKQQMNSKKIGRWQRDLETWESNLMNHKMKKELLLHNYDIPNSQGKIPFCKLNNYLIIKFHYKINQYFAQMMDKIISIFYPWPLDYRK